MESALYKLSPFVETVYLQTCNRREMIALNTDRKRLVGFSGDFFGIPGIFIEKNSVYYEGIDALEHMAQTAAGLKSAVFGENEIMGQVKKALMNSISASACGAGMKQVFNLIFHAAKKAKTLTGISKGPASAIGAAIGLAERRMELKKSRVLVIGTGKISEIAAEKLAKKGADVSFIAGRNIEKAEEIAKKTGAKVFPLENIAKPLKAADLVISATSAPHYIIRKDNCGAVLDGRSKRLYIFDLAVPRDVEPDLKSDKVSVIDMDDINEEAGRNIRLRLGEKEKALTIIKEVVQNENLKDRHKEKRARSQAGAGNNKRAYKEESVA
jgi:glutamyl-tRNA reductase